MSGTTLTNIFIISSPLLSYAILLISTPLSDQFYNAIWRDRVRSGKQLMFITVDSSSQHAIFALMLYPQSSLLFFLCSLSFLSFYHLLFMTIFSHLLLCLPFSPSLSHLPAFLPSFLPTYFSPSFTIFLPPSLPTYFSLSNSLPPSLPLSHSLNIALFFLQSAIVSSCERLNAVFYPR